MLDACEVVYGKQCMRGKPTCRWRADGLLSDETRGTSSRQLPAHSSPGVVRTYLLAPVLQVLEIFFTLVTLKV
jgi:hypothetical protein